MREPCSAIEPFSAGLSMAMRGLAAIACSRGMVTTAAGAATLPAWAAAAWARLLDDVKTALISLAPD